MVNLIMKAAPVICVYYTAYIMGDAFGGFFLEKSPSDALSDLFLLFKFTSTCVYERILNKLFSSLDTT